MKSQGPYHPKNKQRDSVRSFTRYTTQRRAQTQPALTPSFFLFGIATIALVLIVAAIFFIFKSHSSSIEDSRNSYPELPLNELIINDKAPEESPLDTFLYYQFSPSQDMQMPELPTGCEATALATLLRMHGIEVSKTEVADAMPKGADWVNCFWGNPYEPTGWACMPPCSVKVANEFLAGTGKTALEYKGSPLAKLPLPCAAWVSIGMEEPLPSNYTKDGYKLFQNTHCLVILSVDENSVTVIDPLEGYVEYNRHTFEYVYETLGSQAVYIE